MTLESLLNPHLIFLKTPLRSKEEAIHFLLERVVHYHRLQARRDELERLLQEREMLGGTTFPSKLCVPHARIPNFADMIVAVAVPTKGFLAEGMEVRLVVLLLTSEDNPKIYLNTLSSVAKISMKKDLMTALLTCRSPQAFLRLVALQRLPVQSEPLAGELARPLTPVEPTFLLTEAAQLLSNDTPLLVVTDSEKRPLGGLSAQDIVNIPLPSLAGTNLQPEFLHQPAFFDNWQPPAEPLERFLRPVPTVSDQLPLSLLALAFQRFPVPHLVVNTQGRLVGLVESRDVLKKILWD